MKEHLREAHHLMGIKKSRTIWSVILLIIPALIVGFNMLVQMNTLQISNNIVNQERIKVAIKSDATNSQIRTLANEIASTPNVKSVKYSSKQHELQQLIKRQGKVFKIDDNLGGTPTLATFYVAIVNPRKLAETSKLLEKLPYVDHVNSNLQNNAQTNHILKLLNIAVLAIEVVFLLITFFVLKVSVKHTVDLRQDIIDKQLEVGATKKFIKAPFVLQSALIGLYSSLLSLPLTIVGYIMACMALNGQANGTIQLVSPLVALSVACVGTIVIFTLFSALSASLSVHIHAKQQED